jgi:hypothetical protein
MVKECRLELIRVGGRSLIGGDSLRRLLSAAPAEALPAD